MSRIITTPTFDIAGVESGATVALTFTPVGGGEAIVVQAQVAAGHSTCTITVTSPLSPGVYTVTARQTDLAGNVSSVSPALAPGLTVDTAVPTISALFPADGATDAGPNANLVITFSENVLANSGHVLIRKISDNTIVEEIVSTSAQVTVAGNQVTIDPSAAFESETGYYIQIDAGGFWDAAGNSYEGIADTTSWNFTTVDSIAPTVTERHFEHGQRELRPGPGDHDPGRLQRGRERHRLASDHA